MLKEDVCRRCEASDAAKAVQNRKLIRVEPDVGAVELTLPSCLFLQIDVLRRIASERAKEDFARKVYPTSQLPAVHGEPCEGQTGNNECK